MTDQPQSTLTLETKIQSLPADRLSQVEDFVDFLLTKLANQASPSEDHILRQSAAKLSEPVFAAIWDNEEDAIYDDFKFGDVVLVPIKTICTETDRHDD